MRVSFRFSHYNYRADASVSRFVVGYDADCVELVCRSVSSAISLRAPVANELSQERANAELTRLSDCDAVLEDAREKLEVQLLLHSPICASTTPYTVSFVHRRSLNVGKRAIRRVSRTNN